MLFLHNTTSWPFGPALSVYRIVQCFGAVNVPVWVIFEGPQGMSLAVSKVIKNPCTPLEFEKWNKLSVVLPQINKKNSHEKVPKADRSMKIYIKHPQNYLYPSCKMAFGYSKPSRRSSATKDFLRAPAAPHPGLQFLEIN